MLVGLKLSFSSVKSICKLLSVLNPPLEALRLVNACFFKEKVHHGHSSERVHPGVLFSLISIGAGAQRCSGVVCCGAECRLNTL